MIFGLEDNKLSHRLIVAREWASLDTFFSILKVHVRDL